LLQIVVEKEKCIGKEGRRRKGGKEKERDENKGRVFFKKSFSLQIKVVLFLFLVL
jgi:hypothetical protein